MSEYTPASQLQRVVPIEVPEFDGPIAVSDLRIRTVTWPAAEQDGYTPEIINDTEKARMTLNALCVLTRMSEHDGLRRQLATKAGRDLYRKNYPDRSTDVEQIIKDDYAEFKFWHRESIGSLRLLHMGMQPTWVSERQSYLRHRFERAYADRKNVNRRNQRMQVLTDYLANTVAVDRNR